MRSGEEYLKVFLELIGGIRTCGEAVLMIFAVKLQYLSFELFKSLLAVKQFMQVFAFRLYLLSYIFPSHHLDGKCGTLSWFFPAYPKLIEVICTFWSKDMVTLNVLH